MMGLLFGAGFCTVIYTSRLYGLILFMLTNHNNRLNFNFISWFPHLCGCWMLFSPFPRLKQPAVLEWVIIM